MIDDPEEEAWQELEAKQNKKWDTSDMAYRPNGLTVDVTDLIQRAIDMERKECAKTYRKIMDDAIKRAILREREACAKLCDELRNENYSGETEDWCKATIDCAAAIRGRTE